MGLSLKVEDVKGGYFLLRNIKGHYIKEDELLKKMQDEESHFYLRAKNDEVEVSGYDFTGIFGESRFVYPEKIYAEIKSRDNYKIKFYPHQIDSLNKITLEELANTLVEYSKTIDKKIAVSYSGGLDSSLLAWVFKDRNPLLITVGFEGSEDINVSKERAKILGLDHIVHKIEIKELKEALEYVKHFCFSTMELALSAGFYIAGKVAKENGADILIVGQLADEIFGGYKKYQGLYDKELKNALNEDIKKAIIGLRRDSKAIFSAGIEPMYPYAFKSFFRKATALDTKYKVQKLGLRNIGKILGLPYEIITSKKKAFQYGSRIEKEIKALLRYGL